ncbi:hypothetical protein AJ79_06819 [Helicocarpus griseus UAMH5409]|uniref:Fungal STAND N-terminal Goodbye domain-containing protein n=1 Tax=Helicocarpus griseus UAMH5409 TaxID=1447875 RepID=A0A2B7X903_9EURO|nr:hypothetical protein AJ79_06819 [Helicocarpus griseus UAMH5409]
MKRTKTTLDFLTEKGKKGRSILNFKLKPSNKDAAAFLKTQNGAINTALDFSPTSGVKVDEQQEAIVVVADGSKEPTKGDGDDKLDTSKAYEECFEAQKSYQEVLDKCLAKHRETIAVSNNSSSTEPQPKTTATFQDVEATLNKAMKGLNNVMGARQDRLHQKDFFSRLHKRFVGFRNRAEDAQSFVSFLPSGSEFGSLICGGLTIILKAAAQYASMESSIVDALERINFVMVDKAYISDIHPEDQRMHTLVSSLFASIFTILEFLVQWVFKEPIRRGLETVVTSETYGQELKSLVSKMEYRSGAVRHYAAFLEQKAMKEHIEKMETYMKNLNALGTAVTKKTDEQVEQLGKIEGHVKALDTKLLQANFGQQVFILIASDPPQVPVRSGKQNQIAWSGAQPGTEFMNGNQHRIDPEDLLNSVGYQPDLVAKDCKGILGRPRLDNNGWKKVAEISKHIRLQAFVETEYSHILLIEGGQNSKHVPRSVMSVLTAKVVDALNQLKDSSGTVYCISFFCSEHHRTNEPFSSARDLLITLLLQLIDQHREFDGSLLQDCLDTILHNPADLEQLWNVFESCVRDLPEQTRLFCILDGIGFFETPERRKQEMKFIIQRLQLLGREEIANGPALKLLFTTPARCVSSRQLFEPYEIFISRSTPSKSSFFNRGILSRR